LAGLAPLFLHRHHRDISIRQISFLGAGYSDYLDVLLEPDVETVGARLILDYLAGTVDDWELCDFQELPATSPLRRADVPPAIRALWIPSSACLVLPLNPGDLPRGSKTLRQSLRLLHGMPGMQFETASPRQFDEYLQALVRLHTARWNSREQPGMLASADLQAFHAEVAAGFAAGGYLRFYGLRHRGTLVSVLYGFFCRGKFYYYLSGFDPEYAKFSPGQAVLAHALECAMTEGARSFDFLRNNEPYKQRWGARPNQNYRLLLRSRQRPDRS
jgi:CelD/BcsL family acetyltransferase involved in cellulose biosynthesis